MRGGQESACDGLKSIPPISEVRAPSVPPAVLAAQQLSDTTSGETEISPLHAQDAGEDEVRSVAYDIDATGVVPDEARHLSDDHGAQDPTVALVPDAGLQTGDDHDAYGLSLVSVQADRMWPGAVAVTVHPTCPVTAAVGASPGMSTSAEAFPLVPTPPGPRTLRRDGPPTLQDGGPPAAAVSAVNLDAPPFLMLQPELETPTSTAVKSEPEVSSLPVSDSVPLSPTRLEIKLEPPWPLPRAVKLDPFSSVGDPGYPQRCASGGGPPAHVTAVRQARFEPSKRPLLRLARASSSSGGGRDGTQAPAHPGDATSVDLRAPVEQATWDQARASTAPSDNAMDGGGIPDEEMRPRTHDAARLRADDESTGVCSDERATRSAADARDGGDRNEEEE